MRSASERDSWSMCAMTGNTIFDGVELISSMMRPLGHASFQILRRISMGKLGKLVKVVGDFCRSTTLSSSSAILGNVDVISLTCFLPVVGCRRLFDMAGRERLARD